MLQIVDKCYVRRRRGIEEEEEDDDDDDDDDDKENEEEKETRRQVVKRGIKKYYDKITLINLFKTKFIMTEYAFYLCKK